MGVTQPVSGGDGTSGTKVSLFFLLQNKWSGDEKLSASLKKIIYFLTLLQFLSVIR